MHWSIACTICGTSNGTYNPATEEPPSHRHKFVPGRPVSVYVLLERALV